mgnify:CR=1 FL=1
MKQINIKEAIGKKIVGVEIGAFILITKYEDDSFTFIECNKMNSSQVDFCPINYEELLGDVYFQIDGFVIFSETLEMFMNLKLLNRDKLIKDAKNKKIFT